MTLQSRLVLAAPFVLALAWPMAARAMIAIDLFRPPLRAAAAEAGRCPEIRAGRHVVRLAIEGDGRGHDAELTLAPEGTSDETLACITAAFQAQRYPGTSSSTRRVGTIHVSFPFVVAAPAVPSP